MNLPKRLVFYFNFNEGVFHASFVNASLDCLIASISPACNVFASILD